MVWHGIGVRGDDGGDGRPDGPDRPPNGPESRVEPSTASQSSTDPLPSEKGIDKPDSSTPVEDGRGCRGFSGLNSLSIPAKWKLTGKTLYTLYPLPEALPEFHKAVDDLKGGSR